MVTRPFSKIGPNVRLYPGTYSFILLTTELILDFSNFKFGFLIWAKIVLCIIIGGSAGFKMIIALALGILVKALIPSQVVCVYSSILSLVPIPADLDAIWATISTYCVSG